MFEIRELWEVFKLYILFRTKNDFVFQWGIMKMSHMKSAQLPVSKTFRAGTLGSGTPVRRFSICAVLPSASGLIWTSSWWGGTPWFPGWGPYSLTWPYWNFIQVMALWYQTNHISWASCFSSCLLISAEVKSKGLVSHWLLPVGAFNPFLLQLSCVSWSCSSQGKQAACYWLMLGPAALCAFLIALSLSKTLFLILLFPAPLRPSCGECEAFTLPCSQVLALVRSSWAMPKPSPVLNESKLLNPACLGTYGDAAAVGPYLQWRMI